jgi:hypothetical protein
MYDYLIAFEKRLKLITEKYLQPPTSNNLLVCTKHITGVNRLDSCFPPIITHSACDSTVPSTHCDLLSPFIHYFGLIWIT